MSIAVNIASSSKIGVSLAVLSADHVRTPLFVHTPLLRASA